MKKLFFKKIIRRFVQVSFSTLKHAKEIFRTISRSEGIKGMQADAIHFVSPFQDASAIFDVYIGVNQKRVRNI